MLYKMTLTIDHFVMNEIISQLDEGRGKGYMISKYFYGPKLEPIPKIRIDGKFKAFKNNFKGKVHYSLAIRVDKTNSEFFNSLEERLAFLASTRLDGRPENYRLIKESKGYENVCCKVPTTYPGEVRCLYSKMVDGKRCRKKFIDSIHTPFNGSCIIRVAHTFRGNTTGLMIYVEEIINCDEQKSYFDELNCVRTPILHSLFVSSRLWVMAS